MDSHTTILLSRPVVEGRPRYRVTCSCGRQTPIGSRQAVAQDQKNHRREVKQNA